MATGIVGAIPLIFRPNERFGIEDKYFTAGFFDNYKATEDGDSKLYTIKSDLLLSNYKAFLTEFYDLIEEDACKKTGLSLDELPSVGTPPEFKEIFNSNQRNNNVPFIYTSPYMFSCLGGCVCEEYWLFYSGSHKAMLETYSTLLHMEKILVKSMENPLASAVKFGIFG